MHTTPDLIAAYLASLEARQVPYHTRRAYGGDLRRFVTVVGMDLAQVAVPDIERFLTSGDVQVGTRRRRAATLRSFYHWLVRQEEITVNPMERIVLGPMPEREL
jgi:site-specific recombinase XerD